MSRRLLPVVLCLVLAPAASRAATITYAFQSAPQVATSSSWSVGSSNTVRQFDPSLGTLTSARINLYAQANASYTIQNDSSSTGFVDMSARIQGVLSIAGAGAVRVDAYAGYLRPISDTIAPTSTKALGPYVIGRQFADGDILLNTPAALAPLIGTGALAVSGSGSLQLTLMLSSPPGQPLNVLSRSFTAWTIGEITYSYDPALPVAVPEPASLALLGTGLAGLALGAWCGRRGRAAD